MSSLEPAFPVRWQTMTADGRSLHVMVREQAINLLLDNDSPSFTFDPAGRLHGAFVDGSMLDRHGDACIVQHGAAKRAGGSENDLHWRVPGVSGRS